MRSGASIGAAAPTGAASAGKPENACTRANPQKLVTLATEYPVRIQVEPTRKRPRAV